MSAFAPLDVRGPDSRRKQLIAKLMQQAGHAGAVPVPGASRVGISEGRTFHGAGGGGGRGLPMTQRNNMLASVLARLGVQGHHMVSEVSGGDGQAIDIPHPSQVPGVDPHEVSQGAGDPIAAGGVQPPAQTPPDQAASAAPTFQVGGTPMAVSNPSATGLPDGAMGDGAYHITASGAVMPVGIDEASAAPPGMVPLGNGMYYDPITDAVRGGGALGFGAAARRSG